MNFNNGNVNNNDKTNTNNVRCVRGGTWKSGTAGRVGRRIAMGSARPGLFSAESIHGAYLDCRRRKRGTPGAVTFEMGLADELVSLERELNERTYTPRPSVRFVARRPKFREIVAADFRDRVVHHLFVRAIEPDWERVFIADSFACRPGKGTHAAVDRLGEFVRSVNRGGRQKAFFLQADIKNFFMSIDRWLLLDMLDRRLRKRFRLSVGEVDRCLAAGPRSTRGAPLVGTFGAERVVNTPVQLSLPLPVRGGAPRDGYEDLRWLAGVLVRHDPLKGCRTVGGASVFARIPPHKTLAGCRAGCGVPIGNLTSQFFGNVYLDALDQFVKHTLKVGHYIRYVDDFIILHEDAGQLKEWLAKIVHFLAGVLRLELNSKRTHLKETSCGIDFLGYVVHPGHRLVRRRVVGNLRARLDSFEKLMIERGAATAAVTVRPRSSPYSGSHRPGGLRRPRPDPGSTMSRVHLSLPAAYRYPYDELDLLFAVLNSYLAHMAKADAWRLLGSIWTAYGWLKEYFAIRVSKVVRRYVPPSGFNNLRAQHAWFALRSGGGLMLFQIGNHYELLDRQAKKYGDLLGLAPIGPRPGFARRCGFHRSYLARYVRVALDGGFMVTVVKESGMRLLRLAERRIAVRYLPAAGRQFPKGIVAAGLVPAVAEAL